MKPNMATTSTSSSAGAADVPGRGAEPMQVVAVRLTTEELNALDAAAAAKDMSRSVRLTAEELNALDAAAAAKDMSRSEAIRAALAHFAA